MTKKFENIADQMIDLVGGRDNIVRFSHCVTRLRFDVKDKGLVKKSEVEKLRDVIGSQWSGNQYQVIIGTDVDDAYEAVCKAGGFEKTEKINENLDAGDKKFSWKKLGHAILAYISPTMNGVIVMMMAACMCKTIQTVLGPSMLNAISAEGDAYLVLQFLYDAFFYFLPVYLGYSAAKTLNMNPIYGIYIGSLIIVPGFTSLVGTRETINIIGLNAPVADYSASFLPVILGTWIMSLVYRLFKKIIPNVVSTIFVPTLTILVMLPITFLVCAPLGSYVGNAIGSFFIAMSQSNIVVRIIAAVVLAALFPYLVLSGMHGALTTFAISALLTAGQESYLLPIMTGYNFAVFGVALGAALKTKNPQDRADFIAYFISGIFGSITEPILYGIVLKYKKAMKMLMIACGLVGLYVGIFAPVYYTLSGATILTITVPWTAEGVGTGNVINGTLMLLLGLAAGAVCGYFVDYNHTVES